MGKRSQRKKAKKRDAYYRNKGCDKFDLPQFEAERRRARAIEVKPFSAVHENKEDDCRIRVEKQERFNNDVITQTIFNSMIINS